MSDAKPTVFVVDDDASVRASLELLIESAGWQPEAFGSGQEFLARARVPAPSCLVLDVVLPDLDGCELQERIADRPDLPVIFITGHGDVPTTVRAMRAGADHQRALRERYATLSRREREVMALVAAGLLSKQVGAELGIHEITVKAHRGRVMRKMNAGSLPELVRMAQRLDT